MGPTRGESSLTLLQHNEEDIEALLSDTFPCVMLKVAPLGPDWEDLSTHKHDEGHEFIQTIHCLHRLKYNTSIPPSLTYNTSMPLS